MLQHLVLHMHWVKHTSMLAFHSTCSARSTIPCDVEISAARQHQCSGIGHHLSLVQHPTQRDDRSRLTRHSLGAARSAQASMIVSSGKGCPLCFVPLPMHSKTLSSPAPAGSPASLRHFSSAVSFIIALAAVRVCEFHASMHPLQMHCFCHLLQLRLRLGCCCDEQGQEYGIG
jgi:hypothetical protein